MPAEGKAAVAIIAGGATAGTRLEGAGASLKALIDIGGTPMVSRVARAVRQTPSADRILVLGPQELRDAAAAEGAELLTPATDDFLANIQLAARELAEHAMILVASCDIPLVSSAGLDDLIRKGLAVGADFCYAIVAAERVGQAFPDGRRTLVRLRDGRFTGANAVLVTPDFLRRQSDLIQRTFEARKSVPALLRILGLPFIVRFQLGLLTIAQAERRAGEILQGTARAIVSEDAGLAFDVDKPSDLEAVRAYLAAHPQ